MSEGTPLPPPPPRKPEQRFAPANDRPNPTERDKDFDGPPPPPGGGRRKKKKKKGQ